MKTNLLERLCAAHGISGSEGDVRDIMFGEFKKTCDEVSIDNFGNVIARKGAGGKKIMLAAHMDEIGLIVKHINKEGFLSFVKIGGIDDRSLLYQRVTIKTKKGDITGVIGSKPPHLLKEKDRKKFIEHDEMFIDVGAKNDKEAKKMVEVGDPATFESNFGLLHNNLFYGKALDNRLGCYALLDIMEKLPKNIKNTVYAVGTAQEEVGLKGGRVSAFKLNPDYAIAVDTTIAGGTPQVSERESNLILGKGPAITIMEAQGRGVITHPKIKDSLVNTAKQMRIPYQIDVLEGGMTDAAIIYMTREGIPSGAISIPTRYIHGPTGVFDARDLDNTIKLVVNAIPKLK